MIIIAIIIFLLLSVGLYLILNMQVVVDRCASPCENDPILRDSNGKPVPRACPDVCVVKKKPLYEVIQSNLFDR